VNVVAISTPSSAGWGRRIVDYSGQMVEESDGLFGSIGSAWIGRLLDDLERAGCVECIPDGHYWAVRGS
jgi:hypothetical protein